MCQDNLPANSIIDKPLRVCVCLPSVEYDRLALSEALGDTVRRLGHTTRTGFDGDPEILSADVVLLIGDARRFTRSAQLLQNAEKHRPATVLWQLEALPPPQITARTERLGLQLARIDRNRLPAPWPSIVKRFVPASGKLQGLIRKTLAWRVRRDLARYAPHWAEFDWLLLYCVMDRYRWFREQYSSSWCDMVFAATPQRTELLNSKGIPARYLPVGYHPVWGRDLQIERDIDVLFLGTAGDSLRRAVLSKVKNSLNSKGIELTMMNRPCYGEERTRLLNRTKIVVDLMKTPWEMPVMRLLMCAGCGALVVSNWTGEPTPFDKGHLVQAPTEKIADAAICYLQNEQSRRWIVDAVRAFVTQQLTMQNAVAKMFAQMRPELERSRGR